VPLPVLRLAAAERRPAQLVAAVVGGQPRDAVGHLVGAADEGAVLEVQRMKIWAGVDKVARQMRFTHRVEVSKDGEALHLPLLYLPPLLSFALPPPSRLLRLR
jgi:hypothetical protein